MRRRDDVGRPGRPVAVVAVLAIFAIAMVVGWPGTVAGSDFELQQFEPTPDQDQDYLFGPSTAVGTHGSWTARGVVDVSGSPLVLRDGEGDRQAPLVSSQARLNMMGAVALYDRFHVGLSVPVYVHQGGDAELPEGVEAVDARRGLGDLRLVPRARLMETDLGEVGEFAVAGLVDTHLPTGSGAHLQGSDFRIGPTVVTEALFDEGHRVSARLGYQYRSARTYRNLEVDDTVGWGIAGEVDVHEQVDVVGELMGRVTPSAGLDSHHAPTELLAGVKSDVEPVHLTGGLGVGLTRGYGVPDWRAFVGIGVPMAPRPAEWPEPPAVAEPVEPADDAEVVELELTSPDEGDELDDFLVPVEGRTRPDAGVEIELLRDDTTVETRETSADDEGRFSEEFLLEADGDWTVVVTVDRPDGDEDAASRTAEFAMAGDHCGYPQLNDCHRHARCINVPDGEFDCECRDGYEGDGWNCDPGERVETADVDEQTGQIAISEMVHFEVGSDVIEEESLAVLDEVAGVLEEHPEFDEIRIEGHTDDQGAREFNLELSEQRAESVRDYLVEQGVDDQRLTTVGVGPDEPIADNDTEQGREQNRRVEFHIVDEDE